MDWKLQDAKSKFSEVIRRTLEEGPQMITRHGEEVVVMVPAKEYQQLTGDKPDFKEFLMNAPALDELDIRRDKSLSRGAELDTSPAESS